MKQIIKKMLIIAFLVGITVSCAQKETKETQKEVNLDTNKEEQMETYKFAEWDIVAVMKTNTGTIKLLLETEKAPMTTTNFIGLSSTGYYDGIIFHRIIKDFMIQWGDPDGTGMWGKSIYWEKFDDEFHPDLKNDKYTISMANAGPNTNGSQFFINTKDNNFLDNKHSVFGRVVEWFKTVDKLEKTKTETGDKPVKETKMISVTVQEYKNGKFTDYEFDLDSKLKEIEEQKNKEQEAKKTKAVEAWDNVSVHYTWTFKDWEKFDSSLDRGQPIEFTVWAWQMIPGFDAAVVWMKIGDKKSITLEPKDAYGERSDDNKKELLKKDLTSFTDAWIKLEVWVELPTQMWKIKIIEVSDDSVTIDTNHPMAWKTLNFDIELVDIK